MSRGGGGERQDRTGAPHRTAPPTQPPFLALSSSLTFTSIPVWSFVLSSFHVIVPVHAASLRRLFAACHVQVSSAISQHVSPTACSLIFIPASILRGSLHPHLLHSGS
ncbi:hypothetical protein CKAH01_08417 [Colletotrichum kahawae]|uniref:Uncharacterized protein n=1 Tax=Colletotrichum kahawae TaxID=34407 RepID=A0AAE0D042_COLKA|nr:hypothetical protein CKAH01_08417 [Colletotrichum kahawae]